MFVTKLQEALASKRPFFADPLNFVSIGLAALLNIIHWLILFIKIRPGSARILLHYNVVYGPDLVDKSTFVYLIPLVALIFFILNLYTSAVFYKKEKLAAYFINIASVAVQLIFLVASLVLIVSNGT